MKKQLRNSTFAVMCVLALSACGGNTPQESTTTAPATQEAAPINTVAENSFEIEANDQMQFNKNELKAVAGKEITITLKNVGKMDKAVMGHNFIVLKQGTDIPAYAKAAMDAKATDYIPASEAKNVIAHTKLTGAGESDTIKFTITEKGTYDYICSFPGHYALMKGKLIVE